MTVQTSVLRRLFDISGPSREIAIVLVAKLLLILALSQLFFAPSRHVPPTAKQVADHLLATTR